MSRSDEKRTLSALFDSERRAEEAADALMSLGIPKDAITLTPGQRKGEPGVDHAAFLDAIANFFFTDEERRNYTQGLREGGFLLTVELHGEADREAVVGVLTDGGRLDRDDALG